MLMDERNAKDVTMSLKRYRKRLILFVCLIPVLVFLLWYGNGVVYNFFILSRGADPLIACYERKETLREIRLVLWDYLSIHGEFPSSMEELKENTHIDIDQLLSRPGWAPCGYQIDFAALHSEEVSVVVADPGIIWPPNASKKQLAEKAERMFIYRVALMSDGTVDSYDHLGLTDQ